MKDSAIVTHILVAGFLVAIAGAVQSVKAAPEGDAKEANATRDVRHVLSFGESLKNLSVSERLSTVVVEGDASRLLEARPDSEIECLEVDMQDALRNIHFQPAAGKPATGALPVWVRVASASERDSVCRSGNCLGTFTMVSDANGAFHSVRPERVFASEQVLRLMNDSTLSVCIGMQAPVEGALTIESLPVRACMGPVGCQEKPASIAGYWKGSYRCEDSCDGVREEDGFTIYITQDKDDPSKATFVDTEGGKYSGTLCGSTFTFSGGGSDWTESGKLIFDSQTKVRKLSQYSTHGKCCVGHCTDNLVRQEHFEG
ncbi:MAG: hypothetical protein KDD44_03100 [Bdellovibrionales bacterium]|nr:hypothetical protein [Bdellovibrionales bacterium]